MCFLLTDGRRSTMGLLQPRGGQHACQRRRDREPIYMFFFLLIPRGTQPQYTAGGYIFYVRTASERRSRAYTYTYICYIHTVNKRCASCWHTDADQPWAFLSRAIYLSVSIFNYIYIYTYTYIYIYNPPLTRGALPVGIRTPTNHGPS